MGSILRTLFMIHGLKSRDGKEREEERMLAVERPVKVVRNTVFDSFDET